MGMYGSLVALPPERLAALARAGGDALFGALAEAHFEPDGVSTFNADKFWQVLGLTLSAVTAEDLPAPWGRGGTVCLPGEADPALAEAVAGVDTDADVAALVEQFGEEALEVLQGAGYGPAFRLDPPDVQRLAAALDGVPDERLSSAVDEALAAEAIYPPVGPDEHDELVAEVSSLAGDLRGFVEEAARRGDALLYGVT